MKQIEFDGTIHQFPDDFTDADIAKALNAEKPASTNPILETLGNIPSSAVNLVTNMAQAVAHPIQTAGGLLDVAAGGLHNILPQSITSPMDRAFPNPDTQRSVDAANQVGQFYKNRYGSLSQAGETIKTDPIGAMADVSTVLGLAGGGLKLAGLPQAAKPVLTASKYTNPLYLTGKAVTAAASPVYKFATGMTTSAGYKAVGEAIKGSPEFKDVMRGKVPESEVLKNAQDALDQIKQQRATDYQSKLANIQKAQQTIPIDDIKLSADKWLNRYNITKSPTGELDFSRSTATGTAANEIKDVYNMVQEWGSKAGDTTPAMLDVLKRRIGDFYSTQRQSRAMVSSLEKSVNNKIVSAVPEYADMTRGYAKASEVINDVERAFSLKNTPGGKAAADTALRKLITAIREDNTFRKSLLTTMDKSTGQNLTGEASGLLFKSPWSHRLGPMFTVLGGGLAALASPKLAALIPLSSPRLIGELSVLLGKIGRTAPIASGTGITAYQGGRINSIMNPQMMGEK